MQNDGPCFVYIIVSGDHVKIGISKDPQQRVKDMLTGMPETPYLHHHRLFPSRAAARIVERRLHWKFSKRKSRGEWFRINSAEAVRALNSAVGREYTGKETAALVAAAFEVGKHQRDLFR